MSPLFSTRNLYQFGNNGTSKAQHEIFMFFLKLNISKLILQTSTAGQLFGTGRAISLILMINLSYVAETFQL